MTDMSVHFTEDDPSALQARCGTFLRRRTESAKHLAQAIGCDTRTAESLRAGKHFPGARHLRSILAAFRHDFMDAVFSPEIDAVEARLAEEARLAHENYILATSRLEARRRRLSGGQNNVLQAGDR